jgi:hypothetical protein
MQFFDVLATLNDLPSTFRPNSDWYRQLVDAITTSLAVFTQDADATLDQTAVFENALDGWIDVWGLLINIPRQPLEANAVYRARVQNTLLAWVATLPAVEAWINLYAFGGIVTENLPAVGYVINFPGTVQLSQITAFLQFFNRIRPAGVPFGLQQNGIGLFLGTDEFLGGGMVAGNYLTSLATSVPPGLQASTPNNVPLLPTWLLTDPTLNP